MIFVVSPLPYLISHCQVHEVLMIWSDAYSTFVCHYQHQLPPAEDAHKQKLHGV